MNKMGLDISMRSSGICIIQNSEYIFFLLKTKKEDYDDEELLIHIWNQIKNYIDTYSITHINLEALSLDSISNSTDIISGLHWFLRTNIKIYYPNINLDIIEVTTWRNPLFDKAERKLHTENKRELKLLKQELKLVDKDQKKKLIEENSELILNCDIKELTFRKLPDDIKTQIETITTTKSKYDCADAFFIQQFER